MNNIIEKVKEAGIIGAGGAGFPTHVKLGSQAEYVIVNGAECEPLLRVDQQLMTNYSEELVKALELVVETVGAKKGIIALKKKYKKAIEKLNLILENNEKIELHLLDNFYPAGDEQITVYEVTGRIIPEGGIPLQVGVIVLNVETLLNIKNSVDDIPVTHTYLTVTGAVKEPKTMYLPIGTTVREALELAGGVTIENFAVIDGGPMMGKLLPSIDMPIVKNSKGYIVLPSDHPRILSKSKDLKQMLKEGRTACCHCSLCTEVCPRNLIGHSIQPDKLMRVASYQSTCSATEDVNSAYLCCECGLCEVACVMNLQPWKLNGFLKKTLRENGVKNTHTNTPDAAHPFREYKKFPVPQLISRLGLKPYDVDANLDLDAGKDINEVIIKLSQHIGAKSKAIVNVGDRVEKGQKIAEIPENQLGANIHASIDGVVIAVDDDMIKISSK